MKRVGTKRAVRQTSKINHASPAGPGRSLRPGVEERVDRRDGMNPALFARGFPLQTGEGLLLQLVQ